MDDFLGLGGLLQGAPAQPPVEQKADLEQQWAGYLKNPTTQAALLSFGMELMKPRWQNSSAIPDAIGAGAKTVATAEQEQYTRDQEETKRKTAASAREEDRKTRLEVAKLGADSRAEVATIRTQAMLQGIQERTALKGGPQGAFENQLYMKAAEAARQEFKLLNQSAALFQRPTLSDQEIERRAAERAHQAVISHRLTLGPGAGGAAPAIPGQKTSGNPGGAAPPRGVPGPAGTPEKTSGNPGGTAPLTTDDLRDGIRAKSGTAWDIIMSRDDLYADARKRVKDPEKLDTYREGWKKAQKPIF